MTSAPVHLTGPAEDTRRAYGPTLNALREAVGRSADLWRQIDKPDAPAPGLSWTAAETAAHVVGDLRDYTQALTRHANGYMTHANRPTESPSRLSAKVNARHLEEVPERNLHRLADMLEVAADAYLNAAAAADPTVEIATPNGLVIGPSTMAALLLGEQLIHGLDISRTARIPWTIAAADALPGDSGRADRCAAIPAAPARGGRTHQLRAADARRHLATAWPSMTAQRSSPRRRRRPTASSPRIRSPSCCWATAGSRSCRPCCAGSCGPAAASRGWR